MSSEPIPPLARPRLSSRARVQTDKVTGKPVLLYPEGVLLLNPTGHEIVRLCSGESSVQEIVANLAARYQVPPSQIAAEIGDYLERLRARNLLELLPERPEPTAAGQPHR